jgi:CheY-like chemotaxis protein
VLVAKNGAEAVALYAQHGNEVAAVLLDMAMPVMDGPSTIIALKAMNPKVRIIGSSGQASNGGVAKAVGAGVNHFVPKPYTAETLLKTLRELLDPPDEG